jgi:hypothetical protein
MEAGSDPHISTMKKDPMFDWRPWVPSAMSAAGDPWDKTMVTITRSGARRLSLPITQA